MTTTTNTAAAKQALVHTDNELFDRNLWTSGQSVERPPTCRTCQHSWPITTRKNRPGYRCTLINKPVNSLMRACQYHHDTDDALNK